MEQKHLAVLALLLIFLVGSVMISFLVDDGSQQIMEYIQAVHAKVNNQFEELTSTKSTMKPIDVDPFISSSRLVKETRKSKETLGKKQKQFLISWYNPPPYLNFRTNALLCGFEKCQYKNCNMTVGKKYSAQSDAVIFDGRRVSKKEGFVRKPGQVWIFAAHETPSTFENFGGWKEPQWRYAFNWTMTYDKDNTDILLPYGEIWKYPKYIYRDYRHIAMRKSDGALMINSHCHTRGLREKYVKILSKYIPIDVLGSCGRPWHCGRHYVHDDCFDLLNTTYKFFLAFENAICSYYFSEKVYENFNYDIILIVRGGCYKQALSVFPKGTVISTDSFKTIKELGKYLRKLSRSVNDYADILKQKSQYYSPGYTAVYQRAMCELCERMNKQEKYHKTIPDIVHWANGKNPCRPPTDLH